MSSWQLRIGDHRACLTGGAAPRVAPCAWNEIGGLVPEQRWFLGVGEVSQSDLFPDAALGGSGQRSFQHGRSADDATAVCVRATEVLSCATQTPNGWTEPAVLTAEYSNVAGWSSLARDATVSFPDINADGMLDLCGRGDLGMLCSLQGDDGFGEVALLSDGPYFGDAPSEFWFEFSYFQSIGWPFLGDSTGRPHLCVRSVVGVSCSPPSPDGGGEMIRDVLQTEFTDELGWDDDMYGATIRYGDVDGDGIDGVCGRGAPSLVCALGTDDGSFTKARFWSFREELVDAAGWTQFEAHTRAFSLTDLNGNRCADACLRSPHSTMCRWSTGTTFDEFFLIGSFTDDAGYEAEPHGTSVRWDGYGRTVCARHPEGVQCASC